MADTSELTGISNGQVDLEKQEIQFVLGDTRFQTFNFSVKAGVAEQILMALGRMCTELRSAAVAGNVKRSAAPEDVAASIVQRERLHDKVLLQLITPSQIPYTFSLDREAAIGISADLKTEAEKDVPKGRA